VNDAALTQKANMSFGNNREPITSARQAAEALFAPKPEDEGQLLSDPGQPVAPRRPRVLPALSPPANRRENIDMTAPPKTTGGTRDPGQKIGAR
jgi:hypothetical protein